MASSAVLIASDTADRQFSLFPLAEALVPFSGMVDHVVVSTNAPGTERITGPTPAVGRCEHAVGGLRQRALSVPADVLASRGGLGAWFPGRGRWAGCGTPELDEIVGGAELIVLQSGQVGAMIHRLRRRAPDAVMVYVATAALGGEPPEVRAAIRQGLALSDRVVAIRPALQRELARFARDPVDCFAPPADCMVTASAGPSPYAADRNVVVLGTAELDSVTIAIAASSFPATTFHAFGTIDGDVQGNVRPVGHLPSSAAPAFLAHADVALVASPAPDESPAGILLAEQLSWLNQVGVPTVSPDGAAEEHPHCFTFDPGRSASLRDALAAAMAVRPQRVTRAARSWRDLARELTALPRLGHGTDIRTEAHAG